MDVLVWSAPFLADCVTKMFYSLLSKNTEIYDAKEEEEKLDDPPQINIKDLLMRKMTSEGSEKKKKIEVIKHKIRAVGRL